ncbi:MAG: HlyC/CorC family transporter [Dehalococcoidia bacterium]|nr:hemolysin family protein [Chloroflexota bacterium]MXX19095.1 HlyC/CorC family transporter [Dehalococcoidia bacterium]MYD29090.1 HlyC/CorC family transporter [Dehalococcoidia bacterium]
METGEIVAILVIAAASVVLALVAGAETALERTNVARIQALARQGNAAALRIVGTVERPLEPLGPLTTARILAAAGVVSAFAYIGAVELGTGGAAWIGIAGGAYAALVQMTVGTLAARRPEYSVLQLHRVIVAARWVFAAPAWALSVPARVIAAPLQGVGPGSQNEDILALLEREEATGGVEEEEERMIRGIIGLEDKTAREVMVPRIDIVATEVEASVREAARLATERGFSRIPAYGESIDDIAGLAYAKDMLDAILTGQDSSLRALLREAVFIPETKRADQLLTEMRANRTHLAIVVDEYGGTAGLITIEDLIEEIVGEIEDEYDVAGPAMEQISEDEVLLDASMPAEVLEELFDYSAESEDFDTVGGFVIHELGRLPAVGDEVAVDGLRLRVLSMSGRRLRRLRVARERASA